MTDRMLDLVAALQAEGAIVRVEPDGVVMKAGGLKVEAQGQHAKVWLDEQEISQRLTGLDISLAVGSLPEARVVLKLLFVTVLLFVAPAWPGEWVDVQPWARGAEPRIEYGLPPASENGSFQARSCPSGGCSYVPRSYDRPRVIESWSRVGDQGSIGRRAQGIESYRVTVIR